MVLIPQGFIPVQALIACEVVAVEVHGCVENQLSSRGRVSAVTVLRPVELVIGPQGVGVSRQNEGK